MDRTRKRRILEKLDEDGFITVSGVSELLGCAPVTVRRELEELEKQGLLKRVHGGAVRTGSNFVHNNVKEAFYQRIYDKMEIAKMAYDTIAAGETILVDDASTCPHLGSLIVNGREKPLHVITNSILLAERLLDCPHVDLTVIGGSVAKNLAATEGDAAWKQLEEVSADRAFIGVNGIDFERGISLTGYPQQKVKSLMMARSRSAYILADSGKFGKYYMSLLCPADEPTGIITDQNVDPRVLAKAREKGITILVKDRKRSKSDENG